MQLRRSMYVLFSVLLVAVFVLSACSTPAATPTSEPTMAPTTEPTMAPTEVPTEAPTATEAMPAIGSADHPIKVLFVPSVDAQVIVSGGQVMADALNKATDLNFEVSVPTSYAATVEAMCASPTDTIGFIPAMAYVIANQLCGVDVAFKAVRFGSDVYWAEVLVQRDSPYQTLADLNGLKWGATDATSTSGYQVPLAMFKDAGITPGETVETGGHPQAVQAVYNGQVDFATAFYSPPTKPEGEPAWQQGDAPDIPDDLVDQCALNDDGSHIVCGGWVLQDARNNIRDQAPDVVQKVRILTLSPAIPNDTMSFSPDFPADLRTQVEDAITAFSQTEDWANSIGSSDFYGWTGINPAKDSDYDFVRLMAEANGVTPDNYGK